MRTGSFVCSQSQNMIMMFFALRKWRGKRQKKKINSKLKIKEIFSLHLPFQLLKLLLQAAPVVKTFKERFVAYVDKDTQSYSS